MAKFKVKAYSVDLYEQEVEAKTEEDAQDKLLEKIENAEIAPEEGTVFFSDDESFSILAELVSDDECDDCNKEECECEDKECECCKK